MTIIAQVRLIDGQETRSVILRQGEMREIQSNHTHTMRGFGLSRTCPSQCLHRASEVLVNIGIPQLSKPSQDLSRITEGKKLSLPFLAEEHISHVKQSDVYFEKYDAKETSKSLC